MRIWPIFTFFNSPFFSSAFFSFAIFASLKVVDDGVPVQVIYAVFNGFTEIYKKRYP